MYQLIREQKLIPEFFCFQNGELSTNTVKVRLFDQICARVDGSPTSTNVRPVFQHERTEKGGPVSLLKPKI